MSKYSTLLPKISIVMPSYNSSLFIQEAVASVLEQTYTNFELIIVDDASSDNSFQLIQELEKCDSRIQAHLLTRNMGSGFARNYGIAFATGEWLATLDADDRFLSTKLERQIELTKSSSENFVLIGTNSFIINAQSDRVRSYTYPKKCAALKNNLYRMKKFPAHSSLLFKLNAIRELGGFNAKFEKTEDYDLFLRLSTLGDFGLVNEYLIDYRVHGNNKTNSKRGSDSIVYGIAANMCHFFRRFNFPDPSAAIDKNQWDDFLRWVARESLCIDTINYYKIKKEILNRIRMEKGYFITIIEIISISIRYPGVIKRMVVERFFGTHLPRKLAEKWMREQSCIAA